MAFSGPTHEVLKDVISGTVRFSSQVTLDELFRSRRFGRSLVSWWEDSEWSPPLQKPLKELGDLVAAHRALGFVVINFPAFLLRSCNKYDPVFGSACMVGTRLWRGQDYRCSWTTWRSLVAPFVGLHISLLTKLAPLEEDDFDDQ